MEDTFDLMGNSTSAAPSKHQLKKERKAARKNRKNRRQHSANGDSLSNQNSITEENQDNNSESGSWFSHIRILCLKNIICLKNNSFQKKATQTSKTTLNQRLCRDPKWESLATARRNLRPLPALCLRVVLRLLTISRR